MVLLKVKYHIDDLPRFTMVEGSDWVDMYAAETVEFKQFEYKLISLGVSVKMPSGYEMHIAPRSSTFKTWGLIQTNSVGVIDNSYCGNNDILKYPALAMRDTVVSKGDKICQFRLIKNQEPIMFEEVADLYSVDRGGFGSTGKV